VAEERGVTDVQERRPVARCERPASQPGIATERRRDALAVAEQERRDEAGVGQLRVSLEVPLGLVAGRLGRGLDEAGEPLLVGRAVGLDGVLEVGPARVAELARDRALCVGELRRRSDALDGGLVAVARRAQQLLGALARLLEIDGKSGHDDLLVRARGPLRRAGDVVSWSCSKPEVGSALSADWMRPRAPAERTTGFPRTRDPEPGPGHP
jgi:hypothetical protein